MKDRQISTMSLRRISAMLYQEFYITRRSLEVIFDLFFLSFVEVVLFGYVSRYLSFSFASSSQYYLLLGIMLWEVVRVAQYTASLGAMWNIWSRNLSNLFIAPLSVAEFMASQMLSGAIKSAVVLAGAGVIAAGMFGFNLVQVGWLNLLLFFVNLLIFAWSAGIAILGFIFRYGTRIQAFAWGLIVLFQPLSAAMFPVSVLPTPLQWLAYALPPTYVFEAARASLHNPAVQWDYAAIALILNLVYFALAAWLFRALFNASKNTGQFARNEH